MCFGVVNPFYNMLLKALSTPTFVETPRTENAQVYDRNPVHGGTSHSHSFGVLTIRGIYVSNASSISDIDASLLSRRMHSVSDVRVAHGPVGHPGGHGVAHILVGVLE